MFSMEPGKVLGASPRLRTENIACSSQYLFENSAGLLHLMANA